MVCPTRCTTNNSKNKADRIYRVSARRTVSGDSVTEPQETLKR